MAQQICPVLEKAPEKTSGATCLGSESPRMMAGSLPPSSSVTRFMSLAQAAMIFLPVATEPVKEILRTASALTMWVPTLKPWWSAPETMLKTPGGKTSLISSATRAPVSGVYGDGLCTKVLPQVMLGAHFWIEVNIGKFQGVMPPTTPMGLRTATTLKSSSSE
jgi:hypothetical protein